VRRWNDVTCGRHGVYQIQSGFPFTISVYGDTADAGTVVGENPIRANYTGQPVYGNGTGNTNEWFNPEAFATPAACTFGNDFDGVSARQQVDRFE